MTDRIVWNKTSPSTQFVLEADYVGMSIDGNYSMVDCFVRAVNTGNTSSYDGGDGVHHGYVEGVGTFAWRQAQPFMPSGYQNGQLRWRVGGRVHIGHNADGTRGPARVVMAVSYPGVGDSGFFDIGLPTIPRATTGSFSGGGTFDAGTAKTISLPRASSMFTHDVTFQFGTQTGTIATGAGVSAAWTPPLTLLAQIPNAVEGTGKITVVTKNGTTVIGSKETAFTLRAGPGIVPTISAINALDDNPDTTSLIGGYVQGQSRLKATVTAAGVQGSTIASSQVTVDGTTVTSGTAMPLPISGTRAVAAAVVDSRGRTGTASGTVAVLPYSVPQINTFTAERCTAAGVADVNGVYLKITLNASVSSLVVGTEKNALTVRVHTRERGTGPWTARNVIATGLTYNSSVVITGGGIFLTTKAWDVKVEAADKLQKSEDYYLAPTAGAVLDATPTKQAFGKMVEDSGPASQIQGPARVYGTLDSDERMTAPEVYQGAARVEPVGILTAFAGATAPAGWLLCDGAAVSRTTYAALFAVIGTAYGVGNGSSTFNVPDFRGRAPVGFDGTQAEFNALGKTGGTKTHLLTIDEIPSHSHSTRADINAYPGGVTSSLYFGTNTPSHAAYGGLIGSTGGGLPHNNLQPFLTVNHIIKAQ
ncbi:DUF859 family phage minor structural protein [Microbacterium aurantiacum]|uniref:DUF859 family phage minor structural protein n=1 Tax=Microbacterium aurantiacum TaxID=162393 RepID=UPI000C8095D9|nr:DUF859 family phage minor structural protein [Microbacterium aurantiacum]